MMIVCDRLVLRGREKSVASVAALAVVERLDVVEELAAQFGLGRPCASVHEFFLERGEEALGDGVVVAVAAAADRLGDAGGAGLLAERERDELGGFQRSSQHSMMEGCDGQAEG